MTQTTLLSGNESADAAMSGVRRATSLQGWVLVSTSWLSVMASAVIAPVLPKIAAEYRHVPNVNLLISLVATLPALFIALLAAPFGLIADSIGYKRLLLWAVFLYGFLGVAPYHLQSLQAIVGSRAGVGITEAAVMTCGTALLGEYFSGANRERWFAIQTGSGTLVATLMVVVAAFLSAGGWRIAFLMYGFSFLLFPLVLFVIWEPRAPAASTVKVVPQADAQSAVSFRWLYLIGICLTTVFASTAFYIVVVQIAFLLTERGFTTPKLIGMGAALASLAMPFGAVLSRLLKIHYSLRLAVSFALSAVGFLVIGVTRGYASTVGGAMISGLGAGLALPTLISWALSDIPAALRGRTSGMWQSSFFFGQFLSPLAVLALASIFRSRTRSVIVYAVLCTGFSLAFSLFSRRMRGSTMVEAPESQGTSQAPLPNHATSV